MDISISVAVRAPVEVVWREFNEPSSILSWDAGPDWFTVACTNDVRVGGLLEQRIEPRGPGQSLLFSAKYVCVDPLRVLEWQTTDGQRVLVEFNEQRGVVEVLQTFSADPAMSVDRQRADWKGILDSFAQHVERCIT